MSKTVNCKLKVPILKAVQWDGSGDAFQALTDLLDKTQKVLDDQKLSLFIFAGNSIKIETFPALPALDVGNWLLLDEYNQPSIVFKDKFEELYELVK